MNALALDADGTLTFGGCRYTAQQLDDLIHQLALTRAQMTPAIDDSPLKRDEVLEVEDPTVRMAALEGSPRMAMLFKHPGFGWLTFSFTFDKAAQLHNYLGRFLRRTPGPLGFSAGGSQSHY